MGKLDTVFLALKNFPSKLIGLFEMLETDIFAFPPSTGGRENRDRI